MMIAGLPLWVWPGVVGVAALYGSVGHGGASGYIAVLVLAGLSAKATAFPALTLNLFVAGIAAWNYFRAGHFRWPLFWPFAAASIPLAYVGGSVHLPLHVYKMVLAVVLLLSAARFLLLTREVEVGLGRIPRSMALGVGAALGFVSGLIGVGGGIFLTPLLLLLGWADAKQTAAASAAFIWVNSLAGLAGRLAHGPGEWHVAGLLAVAVLMGGLMGSWLGAHRLPRLVIQRLNGAVLLVAGAKLLWT